MLLKQTDLNQSHLRSFFWLIIQIQHSSFGWSPWHKNNNNYKISVFLQMLIENRTNLKTMPLCISKFFPNNPTKLVVVSVATGLPFKTRATQEGNAWAGTEVRTRPQLFQRRRTYCCNIIDAWLNPLCPQVTTGELQPQKGREWRTEKASRENKIRKWKSKKRIN